MTRIVEFNSVTAIEDYAFQRCASLSEVVNFAETPQLINSSTFDGVNTSTCLLRVPQGSPDAYRNYGWGVFINKTELTGNLTVSPATIAFFAGQTRQLQAMVPDSEPVSWSSDNESVATVDATTGLVTAVSAGKVTITASINGGAETADATISVFAAICDDYIASGGTGTLGWSLCADGILHIVGEGAMPDYDANAPWYPYSISYRTPITSVNIGMGVTRIGDYAFNNCFMLSTVALPASVTSIGESVFAGCSNMTYIVDLAATPQTTDNKTFDGINTSTCQLWVPEGSMAAYSEAARWSAFFNTTELSDFTMLSATATLFAGQTKLLRAFAIGGEPVTWSSDNKSVATVDATTGFVTAVAAGKATITASINGGAYTATSDITVFASACTDYIDSGTAGTLFWALCTDGTLQIAGTGDMPNYYDSAPWYYYNNDITSVHIGEGVTHIGNNAFYGCDMLSTVVLPASVTSIGHYAFRECYILSSIVIPASVTSIGNYAFQYCHSLSSVVIPASTKSIGEGAFWECSNLSSVVITASATSIGEGAFHMCSSLTDILDLATTPQTITDYAFEGVNKSTCRLRVPEGSLDAYSKATGWSAFLNTTELSDFTMLPATATLFAGQTKPLQAITVGGEPVTLSSDNEAIATVDATTGLVTAVSAGTATITASINGGATTADATVTVPALVCADCTATGYAGALVWALCTDGILQIAGTGAMPDYDDYIDYHISMPWYAHRNNIRPLRKIGFRKKLYL